MRCFVAIELPEQIRSSIAGLQQRLTPLSSRVRWTPPDQIHLTLKFLGELPDAVVAPVCESVRSAVAAHAPFRVDIRTTGCFPPHGTERIVWAGADPSPELLACQASCDKACAALGCASELRAYHPHLTIGRAKARTTRPGQIRGFLKNHAQWIGGTFLVRQVVVFQSILGADGPQYVVLAHAPLTPIKK